MILLVQCEKSSPLTSPVFSAQAFSAETNTNTKWFMCSTNVKTEVCKLTEDSEGERRVKTLIGT